MTAEPNFRKEALQSLMWAAVQSWGSKILTFVLFVLLARLLTPVEYGTAAAGFLVLTLMGIFAEFGFGIAIIQRPDLKDEDINLPFAVSMLISIVLGIVVALNTGFVEKILDVSGLSPIIVAVAALAPINTAAYFQESLYKRHAMFKQLAFRTLAGTALSGIIACAVAYAGFGVWALIVQMYVMTIINLVWLWSKPVWKPSLRFSLPSFSALAKFSSSIFGMRVLDFAAIRTADIMVVTLFGTATLGLYTASTKLQQVLIYLFQSVISDVAFTFLAKISHDIPRMRKLYINSVTMSIAILSPIFVMLAALAPEICGILFGKKWVMIDQLVRPFLILGALQCVQYLNASYYTAAGQPKHLLYLNIMKAIALLPVFIFSKDEDVFTFVMYFCISQTVVTIPNFYFMTRILEINLPQLVLRFLPFIFASALSFFIIVSTHDVFKQLINGTFIRGIVMGIVFVGCYAGCILLIARKHVFETIDFIRNRKVE